MAGEPRPPLEPSVVDDLIRRTRKFFSEIADDYVKRPLDDLFRWALGRAAAYLVAAGIFITAAVFLFIAGVEGLKTLQVPPVWAYLALGTAGLVAGWIVLRAGRPRSGK